jgi:hypothetical protein
MAPITVPFSQGLVTARDANDLQPGELQTAEGIYYKPGDTGRAHKIPGRSSFGDTGSAAAIKGVALCKFDSGGTDYLLAHSGTKVYAATPGATGTFSELITGLTSSSTHFGAAHHNDRWYLFNGVDRNRILKSDGTVVSMGMVRPVTPPTIASTSVAVGDTYPTAVTNGSPGFTNTANAYDSTGEYTDTYAYATATTASTTTCTWTTWGSSTAAGRVLQIKWGVDIPVGAGIKIEVYNGTIWTTLIEKSYRGQSDDQIRSKDGKTTTGSDSGDLARSKGGWLAWNVSDAVNSNLIQVKATLTYTEGSIPANFYIYHIVISDGGSLAAFSTTTGIYYGLSEYDSVTGTESPAVVAPLLTMSSKNINTLTLPTATNSRATHWRIYRTTDGGTQPETLGLLEDVPISQTTYKDLFTKADKDTQLFPLLPLLTITAENQTDYYELFLPPPEFSDLVHFKGHMVGLTPVDPRALCYTPAGQPESWPAIYVNMKFPISEHDSLVKSIDLGETLLVFANEAVFRLTDLTEVIMGSFIDSQVSVIKGQPGCVGKKAATAFSLAGESQAAWVSPYGIHQTNGTICNRITNDLDWSTHVSQAYLSTAVLRWIADIQCLLFAYDSDGGGTNDRFMLIHMGPEHQKANGLPKITGPSYGSIADLVSGLVSSTHRTYSGHTSNGYVYLDLSGTTDASQSYSGTTIPYTAKSGKIYGPIRLFGTGVASLRHSDWGSNSATVTWTTGRGASGTTQTATKTVSLSGAQNNDFFVGRAGEWCEVQVSCNSGSGALQDVRFEPLVMGKAGQVRAS